jgi:hypothetical protein
MTHHCTGTRRLLCGGLLGLLLATSVCAARSGPIAAQVLDAQTKATKGDREAMLAETFLRLGYVLHLVQDLAVPAHVRNDFGSHFHFCSLGDRLASLGTDLGSLQLTAVGSGIAEAVTVRVEDTVRRVYFLYFAPDNDGVWCLEGL